VVTHPPRKTRFRLLVRLYRTGLVTRRVPSERFQASNYPPFPSFLGARSDRFRISCGENSKSVWPQCPEIFEASERLSAHKATVATQVSLEPESAWPFRAQPVEPVVRFFRKSHCPGQKFVAEALRDIVVNYVCRDRAERLWQFGVRSKPACRPGRAAVRGCMLIDTRKPGRPTCGLRKTCRSVG